MTAFYYSLPGRKFCLPGSSFAYKEHEKVHSNLICLLSKSFQLFNCVFLAMRSEFLESAIFVFS